MKTLMRQVGVALLLASSVALGSAAAMADDPNTLLRLTFEDNSDPTKRKLTAEDLQHQQGSSPDWTKDGIYGELVPASGDLKKFESPGQSLELFLDNGQKAGRISCPSNATQGAICFKINGAPGTRIAPYVEDIGTAPQFQTSSDVITRDGTNATIPQKKPAGTSTHAAQLVQAYNDAIALAIKLKDPQRDIDKAPAELQPCRDSKVPCPLANAYSPHEDVAVVMFNEKGEALFPLPQVDEDDTVFIVVVPDKDDVTISELRVTGCDAPPPLRIDGSPISSQKAYRDMIRRPPPRPRYKIAVAKGCAKEGGIKAVVTVQDQDGSKDIPIKTLGLARITVGLALVYDFSLERTFRADAVKGESVPVIVKDEHVRGLVPPIPFVMLRLPSAVPAERSRRASEMFGIGAGFSLTAPLDHLYLGALFEPYPGLGLIGGYHLHREPTLAGGYAEGDRVPGGQITTDKRWQAQPRDFFAGLNVDASVFSRILGLITPK